MAGSKTPDLELVQELKQIISTPKRWISTGEMPWVDAGGRPRGMKFREPLALGNGVQPATLFVQGYFKPTTLPGVDDKLSLSLFFKGHRIIGLDANGFSRHWNSVGIGRPHYQQLVGHPQLHTISDDAIYGYAEPIPEGTFSERVQIFV